LLSGFIVNSIKPIKFAVCSFGCPAMRIWQKESNMKVYFDQYVICCLDGSLRAALEKISKGKHTIKCHSLSSGQRTSWSTFAGPLREWHVPCGFPQHQCYWPTFLQPRLQPPHFRGRRSHKTKCNYWHSFQTHDFHPSAKSQVDTLSLLCLNLMWGLVLQNLMHFLLLDPLYSVPLYFWETTSNAGRVQKHRNKTRCQFYSTSVILLQIYQCCYSESSLVFSSSEITLCSFKTLVKFLTETYWNVPMVDNSQVWFSEVTVIVLSTLCVGLSMP
jgi:hypothetical protein